MEQNIVAIYARVSKKNASEEAGQSLENQIALAREWIAQDASLREMEIKVYRDEGYTGTNMDRPAVKMLLAGIFMRKIQALVVKDFSRLSRNHLQLSELLEVVFVRYPVRVIAISEAYDSFGGSRAGLGEGIKSIFYEYYCRDISRKTKKSLEAKKENGQYAVGRLPFGYRRDSGGSWKICEEEAGQIRRIFGMSLQGQSCASIARLMNKASAGREWKASDIWRILHNPVYAGVRVWHKYENCFQNGFCSESVPREEWRTEKMCHPAIISEQDYALVQRIHSHTAGYGIKKGRRHLFHGITKCGYCGRALCRHRRRAGILVCRENHGEASVQVAQGILWEICRELFAGRKAEGGWKQYDGDMEKELYLRCFIQRIRVEDDKIWIESKVVSGEKCQNCK